MTKYIVTGGTPLRGTVNLHGAKNVGFKVMIAALLADTPSTITNLGRISEIEFAKEAITALGGEVRHEADPHCLVVDPTNLNSFTLPDAIGARSRASNLYAPALVTRFGQAIVPQPGGDKISRRPLERHLQGIEAMGAIVKQTDSAIEFSAPNGLTGTTYRFAKNTHTGTEFLLMAAVCARGETTLENAAAEPEVDDLIKFLNAMGAKITRLAERTIKIVGVAKLHGAQHQIMPDRNEAVTFACAVLATTGQVKIVGANSVVLAAFLDQVKKAGANYQSLNDAITIASGPSLKATNIVATFHPGFMTDWQPLWATVMTQAHGESTIHETVHERRFEYVSYLIKMGAKIEFFEPKVTDSESVYNFNLSDDSPDNKHAIRVFGPTPLSGIEITVNDVRSGAAALLAGVVASGQTVVVDPNDQIKRGYEDLPGQLVGLGAKIEYN